MKQKRMRFDKQGTEEESAFVCRVPVLVVLSRMKRALNPQQIANLWRSKMYPMHFSFVLENFKGEGKEGGGGGKQNDWK